MPIPKWLERLLGHEGDPYPYEVLVTYEEEAGMPTTDRFSFYANNVDEALKMVDYWMPRRTCTMDGYEGRKYVPVEIKIQIRREALKGKK